MLQSKTKQEWLSLLKKKKRIGGNNESKNKQKKARLCLKVRKIHSKYEFLSHKAWKEKKNSQKRIWARLQLQQKEMGDR